MSNNVEKMSGKLKCKIAAFALAGVAIAGAAAQKFIPADAEDRTANVVACALEGAVIGASLALDREIARRDRKSARSQKRIEAMPQ